MTGVSGDDRAISEGAGVATLVLLTVLVTASVGAGVLLVGADDDSGLQAEFDFKHFSERNSLLITYSEGPALDAGNLTIVAPGKRLTWATLRDLNATDQVTPGSRVQLNAQNAYGFRVSSRANVSVVYTHGDNESVLGTHTGSA